MTTTEVLPLAEMQAEVAAYCELMGWNDSPVTFPAALALLHSEVAEASDAWRVHGLADATRYLEHMHEDDGTVEGCPGCFQNPKPEGVGSEFADILIRALDDSDRFGLPTTDYVEADQGVFALDDGFLENMNALHCAIARVSLARETCYEDPARELAGVIMFLRQLCGLYGIDLQAEYTRKMAYNRTRPRRHGGKRA
jgi:NTP pyrophosphatase (non-canonical NTP hydrolase)